MLAGADRRARAGPIPGFYDDVVPLTDRERQELAALPFDEKEYFEQIGVAGAVGEEGYTTLERRWARPTFDINGLWSGYQGEGAKTVLPATAGAKFSFRLVPNQDPAKITAGAEAEARRALSAGHHDGVDRPARLAGRAGAAGQPLRRGRGPGDRARLRPPARSSPAKAARFPSSPPSTSTEGRHAADGLGPGRRQHPQPEREVLPGRFPPRHQGQRAAVGRTAKDDCRLTKAAKRFHCFLTL